MRRGSIPSRGKKFFLFQNIQTVSGGGGPIALDNACRLFFTREKSGRSVKLSSYLHPAPRSGMGGAVPLLFTKRSQPTHRQLYLPLRK
jgi:hypothetical protein